MTYQSAVLYNGHVVRGNKSVRPNAVVAPSIRQYPAADAGTAMLVDKLRSRSSKTIYTIRRQNSSDLIKMAYESTPTSYQPTPVYNSGNVNINETQMNIARTVLPRATPVRATANAGTNLNIPASVSAQARKVGAGVQRQPYGPAVTPSGRVINKPVNERIGTQRTGVQHTNARTSAYANTHANERINAPRNSNMRPLPATQKKQNLSNIKGHGGYPASRSNSISAERQRHTGGKAYANAHGHYHAAVAKKPLPIMTLSLIVLCAALLMMIIYSAMQNYQYKNEIAELQTKLTTLKAEAEDLRLSLEARDDLAEIEKRAVEIGMVKTGQVEQRYINIGASDAVENLKTDKNEPTTLATMFSAFGRTLSRFFSGK